MKRSKKSVVTLILAVMMIAAMAVSAFADNHTITISNNKDGNVFTIYKVMEGTAAPGNDNQTLYTYTVVNPFGNFFADNDYGFTLNNQNEILRNGTVVAGTGFDNKLDTTSDRAILASALANFAKANDVAGVATVSNANASEGLASGYYLVVQTASANVNDKEVASKPILISLTGEDVAVAPKKDETTLDKEILENGSEVKANNVNIGDDVAYKITTKIPTYAANVDKTKLSFVLSDHFTNLTYNNDLVIAGFTANEDYTAAYDEASATLTITFKTDAIYAHQGDTVVANYSAKLNSNAVIEGNGNPNKVTLTYANNPGFDESSKTLEDETKTYTYGFKIHKVDKVEESKNLENAVFEIKDKEGKVAYFTEDKDNKGQYTFVKFVGEGETAPAGTTKDVTSLGGTTLAEVKGLDAGTYTMTETHAPDGYTKLAGDITVTIADQGEQTSQTKQPNGIAVITVSENVSVKDESGNTTGNVESQNGTIDLAVYVKNAKGISLPETGATSALVCMIGGALIVLIGLLYYFIAVRRSKKTSR